MRPLEIVYALFAAIALVTALYYGVPYWVSPTASFSEFGTMAHANGPAALLSTDVAILYILASFWIVVEGRRLRLRNLWVYLLANTFVAVAFGLALFLFARERRVNERS